ncbi:MAG: translation initiation factor IF-1 [Sandaracinaceae bacterium]|jgi:translation initiation factor IF-1|nr:translation initiation factor IF-1 [Sandaracinaceae bacterium]
MSQGDHLELQGVVTDVFAGGNFKIETDQGVEIRARLGGRLRRNRIRVLLGDRVTVRVSPYDLTHGLITYRHK